MTGYVITEPGLYGDIAEDVYHADPVPDGSLSVSGAKKLLPPSCPAIFHHQRRHPKPRTRAMDFGTVAHSLILSKGQDTEIIDAPDYRTKAAQQLRDKAIAAGRVPMLTHEWHKALSVEAAVRDDDDAGPLFDSGDAEQSMFWTDPEWDIWLRSRMDWLTYFDMPTIVDLKTASDASPGKFARSVHDYGYYMQDPWYRDGLAAILGCNPDDIDFVFVVVQTTEPHLVMTYRLDDAAVALGRECNRIAREKYRDCTEAGVWPKWSHDITPLALPPYARRRIESEINEYFD